MVGSEGIQVVSLSLGYVMGQALHAAAELGIADVLADGPRDVEQIATATGTHGRSLRRLLRTLAGGGIVREAESGQFMLTTLGETLRRDVPDSVRSAVIWVSQPMHYATCGDLTGTVRTGEPAFDRLFGRPYFEYLAGDPAAGRVWDEGMACFSAMENAPISQAYAFPRRACVVDVGGGQGGFLAEVLKTDPTLRGVLFDLPAVVQTPQLLRDAGVLDRCELVGGDFFDAFPAGGDVYVLKRVLHDWDDSTCVDLLTRCRKVMPSVGRLLVIDAVVPPGNDPHPAKIVDMVMMGILSGRERTEPELAELFTAAGFTLTRVIPTHSMLAIAEGIPA
jgi:DNA-binding transcriptional ArsR family regulator